MNAHMDTSMILGRVGITPAQVRAALGGETRRKPRGHRLPEGLVAKMYAHYLQTGSSIMTGLEFNRQPTTLRLIFKRHGLALINPRRKRPFIDRDGVRYTLKDGGRSYRAMVDGKQHLLHHVVWEESFGPVPQGHVVTFRDGNSENFSASNLVCLPRSEACSFLRKGTIKRLREERRKP